MSTFRGGRGTSRGRGSSTFGGAGTTSGNAANSETRAPRPDFNTQTSRGRASNQLRLNGSARGRGGKAQQPTARAGSALRGRGAVSAVFNTPRAEPPAISASSFSSSSPSHGAGDAASYQDRFQALKKKRERERVDAIARGFLADPDKPRTLAEAITPVGTCPDMCAEFERVERTVQKDVWNAEMESGSDDNTPAEHLMVKKFRRAAAGLDEQLPSDLRPPAVLKKTVDYLFNDVVGSAESLGDVHHFVWDRTRAIRNDFSIQQMTKLPDVEIAIDCYERIARFHILSLHQLALPEKPYDKYDWYQEREQLDRTLLSLMQYYDDIKGRLVCRNEPEFRAYLVIFQAQDPTPDLEERVNAWESHVKTSPRIRRALDLYNAACNVLDPQGPLKPRAVHPVAQEDWNRFFTLVQSNAVSYLMACVSEIYFNLVRRTTLNAIWLAFRPQSSRHDVADFTVDLMTDLLGFDDRDQAVHFCQQFGFVFKESQAGPAFLDLKSVQGTTFPAAAQGMPHQTFSDRLVESKRAGRTFPAIISGFSVLYAQKNGFVEDDVQEEGMMEEDDEESLFVGEDPEKNRLPISTSTGSSGAFATSPFSNTPSESKTTTAGGATWSAPPVANKSPFSPFAVPSGSSQTTTSPFASQSAFGQPSRTGLDNTIANKPASSPFSVGQVSTSGSTGFPASQGVSKPSTPSVFGQQSSSATQASDGQNPAPRFNFTQPSAVTAKPSADDASVAERATKSPQITPASDSGSFPALVAPKTTPTSLGTSTSNNSWPSAPFKASSPFVSQPLASTGTETATSSISAPASETKTFSAAPFFSPMTTGTTATTSSIFTPSASSPCAANPNISKDTSVGSEPAKTPFFQNINVQQENQQPTRKDEYAHPAGTSALAGGKPALPSTSTSSQNPQTVSDAPPGTAPLPNTTSVSQQRSFSPQSKSSVTFAAQPNQPKKPSPLSQSFSGPDSSNNESKDLGKSVRFQEHSQAPETSTEGLRKESGLLSSIATPVFTPAERPPTPSLSKEDLLHNLAREATLDIDTGFIRQFVEFSARQIILSVYDQLYMENLQQLADTFRAETLASRYGRRWRDICWHRRLVRRGRERRKRAKKDQSTKEMEKKLAAETNAVDEFLTSMRGKNVNDSRRNPVEHHDRKEVDKMGASQQSGVGAILHGSVGHASQTQNGRDLKNGERKDHHESVRRSEVAVSRDATPARASYLSFSTQGTPGGGSVQTKSARSNYFRLRALGIDPNGGVAATPLGRKRAREDSEEALSEIHSVSKKSKSPPISITSSKAFDLESQKSLSQRRSISIDRPRSKAEHDDEALFARARAARQALSDSAAWYRSQIQDDEDQQRQGLARSLDTPSMQRAREAARLRASQNGLGFRGSIAESALTPRVPAYRFRQSKFVPQDQYGKAVLKPKEMVGDRANTSLQTSLASIRGGVYGSRPATSSYPAPVSEAATATHRHTQPYFFAPFNQDSTQGTVMSDPRIARDTPAVAEALYHTMMQPSQSDLHEGMNGDTLPTPTVNSSTNINGVGDKESLGDRSVQDWTHADDHATRDGDSVDAEEYEDEEEMFMDEESSTQNQDYYNSEEELYDEDEEDYDEGGEGEEDEEESELDDEEDATDSMRTPSSQPVLKGQLSGASFIKAGTGTQEDAFELSD